MSRKGIKSYLIQLVLVLASQVACFAQTHPTNDIRNVDFQNFTYESDDQILRIRAGRGTYRGHGNEVFSYRVERLSVAYGDLTSDGKEEAAMTFYYTGGGSGTFSKGFLFSLREGRLALLTTFEGGDRGDGGISEVSIEAGVLRVRRNEPERMNNVPVGLCCPKYLIGTDYRWDGKRLVQTGQPQKVEIN